MNLSRLFILRPIATSLLMIALVLIGVLSYRSLPVAALPDVDYPTLQITASYPGASAQLVASTITAPLEKQFALMPGLTQMESISSYGISVITLSFDLTLPLDIAEQQVQAGINAASNLLPAELPFPPVYHKLNPADTPILTLAVTSSAMTQRDLQAWVDSRLVMQLSQVSGVGLISLAGNQRPAIRIAVNPSALSAHKLSLEQIRQIIAQENVHLSKGGFQGELRASSIDANDQLMSVEAYRSLIIAYQQGSPLRLEDVARVEDSAEDIYRHAWYQDERAILLNVYRQPNTTVTATAERVKRQLDDIQTQLPSAMTIHIASDRTQSIRANLQATQGDLWVAIVLVVAIMWLFLRQWSLTIIPALTIPLSLLTSLAMLSMAGFSLNLLSLLALIIATGFVVDDSIVMLENISRHRAMGKSAIQAAIDGAQEITITIIALTLALLAVLIPLLFMEGIMGRLFYEFALTLGTALISSALISLTLTPMLAGRLSFSDDYRGSRGSRGNRASHNASRLSRYAQIAPLTTLRQGYVRLLRMALNHPWQMMLWNVIMMLLSVWLLFVLPKAFFPEQDTDQLQGEVMTEQNASFAQVQAKVFALSERLQKDPNVASVTCFVGVDAQNPSPITGKLSIQLIPRQQRTQSAQTLIATFEAMSQSFSGMTFHAFATQAITLDAYPSAKPYQIRLSDPSFEVVQTKTQLLTDAMRQSPYFLGVHHRLQADGLSTRLVVDRDQASRLGVSTKEINQTLYDAFGQRVIATLFGQSSQQRVILTLAHSDQSDPSQLQKIYVANAEGQLVPFSALVRIENTTAALTVEKYHQFPSAHIAFALVDGVGLDQALAEIAMLRQSVGLAETTLLEPAGILAIFEQSQGQQLGLFLGAIIAVYILLGMLYESFVHPITILSTLLPAVLGGLLSLLVLAHPLDMMAVIGMVLLVGIVMKNAIMMIDFALSELKERGGEPQAAMLKACELRFRPILMTSLAALLAAVPLVLSTGMGSELRYGIGAVIIGGLVLSQFVTLFTTPALFVLLQRGKQSA